MINHSTNASCIAMIMGLPAVSASAGGRRRQYRRTPAPAYRPLVVLEAVAEACDLGIVA
jgi:hypothetical protein